jgi:hypothetical protein
MLLLRLFLLFALVLPVASNSIVNYPDVAGYITGIRGPKTQPRSKLCENYMYPTPMFALLHPKILGSRINGRCNKLIWIRGPLGEIAVPVAGECRNCKERQIILSYNAFRRVIPGSRPRTVIFSFGGRITAKSNLTLV